MFDLQQLKDLSSASGGRYQTGTLTDARKFCKKITTQHYENFPVASLLLPKAVREHIYGIYCFARIADDIADEKYDITQENRLRLLEEYQNNFIKSDETTNNPVFSALHDTIKIKQLPHEPFLKLLEAFRRDIMFRQADSFDDLLEYCSYSANPVGEIILRLFNEYNESNNKFSDNICTALQLTNFWQDISVDRKNNRCYIPKDAFNKHGIDIVDYYRDNDKSIFSGCLNELFDHTEKLFESGRQLTQSVKSSGLRQELKVTILGGKTMLKKCRSLSIKLFNERPKLNKIDFFSIFVRFIFNKY